MSNLHFSSQILVKIVVKISSQISSNCFRKPPSIGNFRFKKNSDSIQSVRFNPFGPIQSNFNPFGPIRIHFFVSISRLWFGNESIRFNQISIDSIRFDSIQSTRSDSNPFFVSFIDYLVNTVDFLVKSPSQFSCQF